MPNLKTWVRTLHSSISRACTCTCNGNTQYVLIKLITTDIIILHTVHEQVCASNKCELWQISSFECFNFYHIYNYSVHLVRFFLLFPDSCSSTDGLGVCHSRNEVTDVLENKVHEADRPSLYHQHPMTWFELYKVKNQHLPLWYISNFVSNSNLTCALYTHRHYYSLKLWCHLLTLYHCYMAGILLIKPIQSINTDVMQHFIFHLIWVQFLKERFFPLSKKKINKYRDFVYLITGKFNIIPKLHQVLLDFLSTYCVFN